MTRVAVLGKIADAWNRAGLDYAVTHGLEGYPEGMGRDLDVLVQRNQVSLALFIASEILEEHGWRVARPAPIWGRRLVATRGDSHFEMIEVHTVSSLSWRNTVFATRPGTREVRGTFRVDPWLSFLKSALFPLLAVDFKKLERNTRGRSFQMDEGDAQERLAVFFGSDLSSDLVRSLSVGDLEVARSLAPELRRSTAIRSWLRNPISSVRLTLGSILRRFRQPFCPCAPTVAVVGPDGVGKSSLIEELARQDDLVFNDVVVRHWRPALLPQLGSLVGRKLPAETSDGLRPPRRTKGRLHWLRISYYAADTLLGTFLKDRVAASRQKLIIYDRCFLDMAVDPLRYGLASSRGVLGLWRFLPKPDLIVLLHDSPERVDVRKPEMPQPEIERQLAVWGGLSARGEVQAVLQVDAGPGELARRLLPLIGEAFHRVNRSPEPTADGSP